jgi:DNA-binding response OmpR family regulator
MTKPFSQRELLARIKAMSYGAQVLAVGASDESCYRQLLAYEFQPI